MKIYVVVTMTCDEYGCMTPCATFSSKEKAQAYIDAQEDKMVEVWWNEELNCNYDINEYWLDQPTREDGLYEE